MEAGLRRAAYQPTRRAQLRPRDGDRPRRRCRLLRLDELDGAATTPRAGRDAGRARRRPGRRPLPAVVDGVGVHDAEGGSSSIGFKTLNFAPTGAFDAPRRADHVRRLRPTVDRVLATRPRVDPRDQCHSCGTPYLTRSIAYQAPPD